MKKMQTKSLPLVVLSGASSCFLNAADITMTVSNIDWNAAMWDTPAAAPTTGNDYFTAVVGANLFRISADGSDSTFLGDSITTIQGTRALVKLTDGGTAIIDGDFILEGGVLSYGPGSGAPTATLQVEDFVVSSTGSTINVNNVASRFIIDGTLTGSGDLTIDKELDGDTSNSTVEFTRIDDFTGPLTVADGMDLDFGQASYEFTNQVSLGEGSVLTINDGQTLTFTRGQLLGSNDSIIPVGVYADTALNDLENFADNGGTLVVKLGADTDNDGLADSFEQLIIDADPNDAIENLEDVLPEGDFDADSGVVAGSASNLNEQTAGTNPVEADSDGDTLLDGDELSGSSNTFAPGTPTDPLSADSDADGANDFEENGSLNIQFSMAPTNPNFVDTDDDGMTDGYELRNNSPTTALNPNDDGTTDPIQAPERDIDLDGISNFAEFNGDTPSSLQTRADLADTDGDGLNDDIEDNAGEWFSEDETGTNPLIADTDDDGLSDGVENPDLEYDPDNPTMQPGTDPNNPDSDSDTVVDGQEIEEGTDPTDSDSFSAPFDEALVRFDFGTDTSDVQVNWTGAPLGNGTNGTISIATTAIGSPTVDSRDRADANTDGAGADIGNTDIWRDFIFSNGSFSTAPDTGLELTLSGLDPSTSYDITIAGYDSSSFGDRSSDWSQVGGTSTERLSFSANNGDPEMITDNSIVLNVISDDAGEVILNGVVSADTPSTSHNVFVNYLVVEEGSASPATGIEITSITFNDTGDLEITFSPGGSGFILTSADDLVGSFTEETNATYDGTNQFTVPASALDTDGNDYFRIQEAP